VEIYNRPAQRRWTVCLSIKEMGVNTMGGLCGSDDNAVVDWRFRGNGR